MASIDCIRQPFKHIMDTGLYHRTAQKRTR